MPQGTGTHRRKNIGVAGCTPPSNTPRGLRSDSLTNTGAENREESGDADDDNINIIDMLAEQLIIYHP
jgi:hypothetical protein